MHMGDVYENRRKLVSGRALQLLRLHASEDDVGTNREFLRFNLGSGLSWLDDHPNISQASSKDGDVVVLYKGKFHVPPVHTAEAAHDAFVRCVVNTGVSGVHDTYNVALSSSMNIMLLYGRTPVSAELMRMRTS